MKINLKQFYNAINKAMERFLKNKHKILCPLGFHKYKYQEIHIEKKGSRTTKYKKMKCKYCQKEQFIFQGHYIKIDKQRGNK